MIDIKNVVKTTFNEVQMNEIVKAVEPRVLANFLQKSIFYLVYNKIRSKVVLFMMKAMEISTKEHRYSCYSLIIKIMDMKYYKHQDNEKCLIT